MTTGVTDLGFCWDPSWTRVVAFQAANMGSRRSPKCTAALAAVRSPSSRHSTARAPEVLGPGFVLGFNIYLVSLLYTLLASTRIGCGKINLRYNLEWSVFFGNFKQPSPKPKNLALQCKCLSLSKPSPGAPHLTYFTLLPLPSTPLAAMQPKHERSSVKSLRLKRIAGRSASTTYCVRSLPIEHSSFPWT